MERSLIPSEFFHINKQTLLWILDNTPDAVMLFDAQNRCEYANQSCLALLRAESIDQLQGQLAFELLPNSSKDSVTDKASEGLSLKHAFEREEDTHVPYDQFRRIDRSEFSVEYWCYPLVEDSKRVGTLLRCRDTSLKRIEQIHRDQLVSLIDSSTDSFISKDLNGTIISWNHGAKLIYGFDPEEAIGMPISIILPNGRTTEENEIIEAVNAGQRITQLEVERKRKSGDPVQVSLTVAPIYDPQGRLMGSFSIARDITPLKQSQVELHRAKETAEHAERLANAANRSRADFLANVSHELRTPMNSIIGMLNLALDEPLPEKVRDYLQTASSSANALLKLLNNILDFSKIESGKFELELEPFDLREALNDVLKSLAAQAFEKGLELSAEVDPNIPEKLIGDSLRVQQVLTNLVSNSIKFTESGEVVVRLEAIRQFSGRVGIQFSISDTGIGIAEKDQKRIFSAFAQADTSSTRRFGGTGLGLTICRELLNMMGSKLRLTSELGKGSLFQFALNFEVHHDSDPKTHLPPELVRDQSVLIVDDNSTNLKILEKMLVNWSMKPLVANSADQALELMNRLKASNQDVSLAIVDAMMPGINGVELAQMIESIDSIDSPPVVLMTSAADIGLVNPDSSGVSRYVTKPVSQSELMDVIIDTLDLYQEPELAGDRRENLTGPTRLLEILLVEDLPANQKVAATILEKRGHGVQIASNGRVAIDMLQHSPDRYDVVLMDIQMPVLDGIQATELIRNMEPESISRIPIIAMTAHAVHGDREMCLAAGMDAYIAKPINAKDLLQLVESVNHKQPTPKLKKKPTDSITLKDLMGGTTPIEPDKSSNKKMASEKSEQAETPQADTNGSFELLELDEAIKRLGGDQELFREFVKIFFEDSPTLIDQIRTAIKAQDAGALQHAAHALKGLISNFGAKRCVDRAFELESAGRYGKMVPMDLENNFSMLLQDYSTLSRELHGFIE